MALTEWLDEAIRSSSITEDACDYLMGRGATPETIVRWGIRVFECPTETCPDPALARRYGGHFEVFAGKVIYPLRSARGILLGMDTRTLGRKDELRFLLPESAWTAIWIGMPEAMPAIWEGQDLLIVEGRYDVFAMLHIFKGPVLGSGPAHLSWRQIEWLRRWVCSPTQRVWVGYDRDAAGHLGTVKGLKRLQDVEVSCSELVYGRLGDDPGKIWDRGGLAALRQEFPYL